MKLKTKFQDEDFELGEVVDVAIGTRAYGGFTLQGKAKAGGLIAFQYHSLKELYDNWEDYEEPNAYYIGRCGIIEEFDPTKDVWLTEMLKEIGNKFETKEEAERAVEKLKAWKRLKDKGFKFESWKYVHPTTRVGEYKVHIEADADPLVSFVKDLNLLFGGEE